MLIKSQSEVHLHTGRSVHFHPSPFTRPSFNWHMWYLPYSGKLSREKTFVNFAVLWLYAKVFSAKFGMWCPLARQKRTIRWSFLHENRIFTNSGKFSPSKVFSLESFPHHCTCFWWRLTCFYESSFAYCACVTVDSDKPCYEPWQSSKSADCCLLRLTPWWWTSSWIWCVVCMQRYMFTTRCFCYKIIRFWLHS